MAMRVHEHRRHHGLVYAGPGGHQPRGPAGVVPVHHVCGWLTVSDCDAVSQIPLAGSVHSLYNSPVVGMESPVQPPVRLMTPIDSE
jgi:hypothetical protein